MMVFSPLPFLLLFFLPSTLFAFFPHDQAPLPATAFRSPLSTPITLEHAHTQEEIAWGLMGRSSLPPNHGMLFHFQHLERQNVWAFNCQMSFSIAFLSPGGEVLEIRKLQAYPERMASLPPILRKQDLFTMDFSHPTVLFFQERSITSRREALYMLEMAQGWFQENSIEPGDHLIWNQGGRSGRLLHTLFLDEALGEKKQLFLQFPQEDHYRLSLKKAGILKLFNRKKQEVHSFQGPFSHPFTPPTPFSSLILEKKEAK